MDETPERRRASYLSVAQEYDLRVACAPIWRAFGGSTYHVGSSLERPDYRDVDVRTILDDAEFARVFAGPGRLALLNVAVSEWLSARTGLPVDFQFQHMTGANADYPGQRNALLPETSL